MHKWILGAGISTALLAVLVGIAVSSYIAVLPVEGWYEQTYSAADAGQMGEWADRLLEEMRSRGMTGGHYALVFRNPHNDVALDIEVFENLRVRCDEVAKYPPGSMDYAESLEDIRRQMDKTDFDPWWWWMVNKHNRATWMLVLSPAWFSGIILGVGIGGDSLHDYLWERRERKLRRERELERERERKTLEEGDSGRSG